MATFDRRAFLVASVAAGAWSQSAGSVLPRPRRSIKKALKYGMIEGELSVRDKFALAKSAGPIAGMASYDAAYILALVPPRAPDPAFWKQVAARFRRSSKLFTDPSHKRAADERATAAEDTAKALR